jgi:Flp pilus assembly protein TadG
MASAPPNLTLRSARRWLRSLARDTAGAVLIEITLFMPILVLMAVAIINFGLYFWYSIQVENAAQAGAQWALNKEVQSSLPWGSTTTSGTVAFLINKAGTSANNPSQPLVYSPTIAVTPTRYCGCPSNVTQAAWTTSCALGIPAGTLCSDGSYPGTYIQVVASGTFTPFAHYGSFFPTAYPVTSTATVRVQ